MLSSLERTMEQVFSFSFPMILISIVVVFSLRIYDLIKNKKRWCFYQDFLILLFIIYILCLFQIVTFQDATYVSGNNLIPFREIFRYSLGSHLFLKNVIGNVLLFLPYGLFVSYFFKEKKLLPIFILVFITSLTIEGTQLMIGRVFDIDDIILNVLGGIFGFFLYQILAKIVSFFPNLLKKEWVLNVLALFLLVGCSFLIFCLL